MRLFCWQLISKSIGRSLNISHVLWVLWQMLILRRPLVSPIILVSSISLVSPIILVSSILHWLRDILNLRRSIWILFLILYLLRSIWILFIYLSKLMEFTRLFLNIFLLVRNQYIFSYKRVERTQSNTLFGNTLVLFFFLEHIPKWFFLRHIFNSAFSFYWLSHGIIYLCSLNRSLRNLWFLGLESLSR